tara:strand:+ start:2217 stop:2945 length:729 start_codon:yes stop_codon:yes gene_type:complete
MPVDIKIKVTMSNADTFTHTVSIDQGNATEAIKQFPCGVPNLTQFMRDQQIGGVGNPEDMQWYRIDLMSDTEVVDSRKFYVTCEPKQTPVHMAFVNKFGMWDYITFFKKSTDSVNVQSEQFKRSTGSINSSGNYSIPKFDPQYKKYNIKSKKTRKLNTGWVGEDHGELMKQLLLSDHVVILSDDRTISATGNGEQRSYTYTQNGVAVNINTSSLEIQKHINDRMINYTIDVEYAFDDLNIAH